MRDAAVENAEAAAYDEGMISAKGPGKAETRSEIVGGVGSASGLRPERVGGESGFGEGLQVVADAEGDVEIVAQADRILCERGVFTSVGLCVGRAEVLDVIAGHVVGISTERGQFQAAFLGYEGERIYFDFVEDVFAAGKRWEKAVDAGDQRVAAELQRVASFLQVQGFGKM